MKTVQRSGVGVRSSELKEKGSAIRPVAEWRPKLKVDEVDRHSQSAVEIRVADTGKGISPEDMDKIFAPYYTSKEKGLGLGLAITQKMIQAHNGTIEIQSVENKGTTVIVRLSIAPLQ